MKLNAKQREALREVIRAKLRLWDASIAAENLFPGVEIDTNGDAIENICASIDTIEQVDSTVTDADLLEIIDESGFGLCERCGCQSTGESHITGESVCSECGADLEAADMKASE